MNRTNMNRQQIEALLEEMGNASVPEPDEVTIARIEQRWRRASTSGGRAPARVRRLHALPSPRVATAGAAALLAVAASVALVVGVQHSRRDDRSFVVADATDVYVVLPSGETIEPLAGQELPEGALIQTGDAASGAIGAVPLVPRTRYVVRNGQVVPAGTVEPTSTVRPTSTTASAVSPTTTPATPSTVRPLSPPEGPTTLVRTTAPTSPVRPARLAVRAAAQPKAASRGVRLTVAWERLSNPEIRRYVVIRVKSWNGRSLPSGKRIANVRAGSSRSAIDRNPKPGFYVVAALGKGNTVLAIGSVDVPTLTAS